MASGPPGYTLACLRAGVARISMSPHNEKIADVALAFSVLGAASIWFASPGKVRMVAGRAKT